MTTHAHLLAESRLAVGIVGVGRAGAALGLALQAAGHRVLAVHAVSADSRGRAETFFPDAEIADITAVAGAAELLLLSVPDDVLPDLVAGLAGAGGVRPGMFVVHASGRYGLHVLDPATAAGAVPLAIHPAMTLTGTRMDVQRLIGCPFGVTAPEPLRPVAEALVMEMGGEPLWVPDDARVAYHAALSHAANHLVTLIADAMDIAAGAGVEQPSRLLGPLVAAALDNVLRVGDGALTGPVSRGDAGTLAAHLQALADCDVLPAYVVMARRTADRALASGRLTPAKGAKLLELLADQQRESGPGGQQGAG